jgi:hypothetical protein
MRVGLWLVAYPIAILIVSAVGSKDFGGTGLIPAPWDSVVVAVIAVIAYEWGVRSAVRHLAAHPAPDPRQADESMPEFGTAPDAAPNAPQEPRT